jgi:hypothetical protein
MKYLKIFLPVLVLLILSSVSYGQKNYIYFATSNESLFDSTCHKRIRILSKGEVFLVTKESTFRKDFINVTCISDGKAGFVHKNHLKKEKELSVDSAGGNALASAKKEYFKPYGRFKNTCKKATIKLFFMNKNYILRPGETQEFNGIKAGTQHYKLQTPGYQPLYTEDDFEPYHIVEVELFLE